MQILCMKKLLTFQKFNSMENNRTLGWTTIEEAKKLVEAGLDPNTADMCYLSYKGFDDKDFRVYGVDAKAYKEKKRETKEFDYVPCWSLGALKNIVEEELGKDFSYENGEWIIIVWTDTWGYKHYYFEEIVNCVIWLIQNGYIKKHE